MKTLFSIVAALSLSLAPVLAAGGTGFTGQPTPQVMTLTLSPNVVIPILTNNFQIVAASFIPTTGGGYVYLFDEYRTNAPYFGTNGVTGSYVSRSGYTTNMVTSYVGYNGYTNYYTNAGYFTYSVTNAAATNVLSPQGVFATVAGQITSASYPMMFNQGGSIWATTNTTAIIYYIPNK